MHPVFFPCGLLHDMYLFICLMFVLNYNWMVSASHSASLNNLNHRCDFLLINKNDVQHSY